MGNLAILQMAEKLLYVIQYAVTQSASKLRIFDLLLKEAPCSMPDSGTPRYVLLFSYKNHTTMRQAYLCERQESTSLCETVPEAVFKTARRGLAVSQSADGQPCQETQTNQDGG